MCVGWQELSSHKVCRQLLLCVLGGKSYLLSVLTVAVIDVCGVQNVSTVAVIDVLGTKLSRQLLL